MKFQEARERFIPKKVKYLFISESPPVEDSQSYFYYRYTTEKDYLFLNLMQALYPRTYKSYLPVRELRKSKRTFLDMFMSNGCYLIESVDVNLPPEMHSGKKIARITAERDKLLKRIKDISDSETKVILISSTVFAACFEFLKDNGINVVNEAGQSIYFPDRWNNKSFHNQMSKLLEKIDWQNKAGRTKNSIKIIKKTNPDS